MSDVEERKKSKCSSPKTNYIYTPVYLLKINGFLEGKDNEHIYKMIDIIQINYKNIACQEVKECLSNLRKKSSVNIQAIANILQYGVKKYEMFGFINDTSDENILAYIGAYLRHIEKHLNGDEHDDESGYKHEAHAICNLNIAIMMLEKRGV